MAGAKPGVHVVQLRPISVPKSMQNGEKFIKWEEDSNAITPVTLRVDQSGYFLYWTDQNEETQFLDLVTIRDTRTGRYAKFPKDPKMREAVNISTQDTLEEKTLTVVYGPDFVNISFVNFCCTKKETAKLWTEELLKMANNLLALNASITSFLKKAYAKIILLTDKTGRIPVKDVVRMFCKHSDDRKRVEKALESTGVASGKDDFIKPQGFTFEVFFEFYRHLTGRGELEKIFEQIAGVNKKHITVDQFVKFLNESQRDPRLNEILYPYANPARARDFISQYEPSVSHAQRGLLSLEGFLRFLLSDDNPIVSAEKFDLSDDMEQPLSHYFINSSHNTYLTGHQFTGKACAEIYRQTLLAGCRCVELDFWNGRNEDPIVYHGYTLVPEIPAKEVIEAIAESAFKTSEFPVVLSFENHCNPKQQAKIAQYCRESFGDMLLNSPLENFPLEPGAELPSVSLLKRKILIKNKKGKPRSQKKPEMVMAAQAINSVAAPSVEKSVPEMPANGEIPRAKLEKEESKESIENADGDTEEVVENDDGEPSDVDDEDDDALLTAEEIRLREKAQKDKGTAGKETHAVAEISALVNYVQPVHFHSFDHAERRNRTYEMSSFVETQATALLKQSPEEFVNYNKRQLSRVYPRGSRMDSSNYMPQVFWNAGCQLVALNWQTLDVAMQLNVGIFEYNNRSGYLLKPHFMRRPDRTFDPFAESTVDGIIAGTVSFQVLSGQFLSDKRVGTYVEVDMYGLPADTVKKRWRTKTVMNNGINPIYDEEPFVFKKVVLPELACLRIAVYEDSNRFIGHRVLPVTGLCPGYRHITLRNEAGQPLGLSTLFVHIVVKDYVPDKLAELAIALSNPIKYQSELQKRAMQLAILTEELEEDELLGELKGDRSALEAKKSDAATRLGTSPAPISKGGDSSLVNGEMGGSTPGSGSSIPHSTDNKRQNSQKTNKFSGTSPEDGNALSTNSPKLEGFDIILVAETLEKLLEHKTIKDKKEELAKRLEKIRKSFEKERDKLKEEQQAKQGKLTQELVRNKSKKNRFIKLSSSTNMESLAVRSGSESAGNGPTLDPDVESKLAELNRSHSERLLSLAQDRSDRERELKGKYHELIFAAVEKIMRTSQDKQLKQLTEAFETEVTNAMKTIKTQTSREFKELSKVHRDKAELTRMKREVSQTIIENGVAEREKLQKAFKEKKLELEKQYEEVLANFREAKAKAHKQIAQEHERSTSRSTDEVFENSRD